MGQAKLRLLIWSKLCADLLRYGIRHLTLQHQDIAQIAVVGLGPEVLVGGRPNELGGNAHSRTRTDDRPFNDCVHVQFARNCRQGLLCPLVLHDRSTRDDAQRADFSEVGNQLVGHAVGEEFLRRVAGQIVQRQDSNGLYWQNGRFRVEVAPGCRGDKSQRKKSSENQSSENQDEILFRFGAVTRVSG